MSLNQEYLARLINTRDYGSLGKMIDVQLNNESWSTICGRIMALRSGYHEKRIAEEKIRDAIVSLLSLRAASSIDKDLIQSFLSLEGNSLKELRRDAIFRSNDLLIEQIEKKNTFFISLEEIASSEYASLSEDIIKSRRNELEAIGSNPSLKKVLSTYYGFTVLTTSLLVTPPTELWTTYTSRNYPLAIEGVSDSLYKSFRDLINEFDIEIELERDYKTLGAFKTLKKKCSDYLVSIIRNIIVMSFYRQHHHRKLAIQELGQIADSRVVPWMHLKMGTVVKKNRVHLIEALANTSHLTSLDNLIEISKDKHSQTASAAVKGIGLIADDKARKYLKELFHSTRVSHIKGSLKSYTYLKDDTVLERVLELLPEVDYIKECLRYLFAIDEKGRKEFISNLDVIHDNLTKARMLDDFIQEIPSEPDWSELYEFVVIQSVTSICDDIVRTFERNIGGTSYRPKLNRLTKVLRLAKAIKSPDLRKRVSKDIGRAAEASNYNKQFLRAISESPWRRKKKSR